MTTYYVSDTGDNGAGTSWATAKTGLAGALALATTAGDIILVDKDHTGDNANTADTTYTVGANISIICVDKDSSDALATMGTATWIGSNGAYYVRLYGVFNVYVYGITFRVGGAAIDHIEIGNSTTTGQYVLDNCYLWQGSTSATAIIRLNSAAGNPSQFANVLKNCTLRFGNTSQFLGIQAKTFLENCTVSSSGSAITKLLDTDSASESSASIINVTGCDLSAMGSATLVGDYALLGTVIAFLNCKLPSTWSALETLTNKSVGAIEVYIINCSNGDKHYSFEYHNAFGSLVTVGDEISGVVYCNDNLTYDGTNKCVWKIVTTSSANYISPFQTPWIDKYHSGTSAITPYLECLRDNSSGAVYKDNEVWAEVSYQGSTGFPISTIANDRKVLLAAAADQAASSKGASDWTGETGTAGYFKIDSGGNITPAEIGHLRARVCVGEPSITVYVDPQIRGT